MQFESEIYRLISSQTEDKKGVFEIEMLPDSKIFDAHFPGNPITPGVCVIGIIQELLDTMREEKFLIQNVDNVKFITPLTPDKKPTVTIELTDKDNLTKVKAVMRDDENVYVRLSLTMA